MKAMSFFKHSILSGILASILSISYQAIYQYLMLTNFDLVVNWGSITGASFLGCSLMSLGYWVFFRYQKQKYISWLNLFFLGLSFVSILSPLTHSLPLEIEFPELFPGLVVPMHFFPALVFVSLFPFFTNSKNADVPQS